MIVALILASFLALTMTFVFGPLGKLLDDVTPRPGALPPKPHPFTTHELRTIPRGAVPTVVALCSALLFGPILPPISGAFNGANLLPLVSAFVAFVSWMVFSAIGGAVVELRDDGALVRRRFAHARFYPYAEIDGATMNDRGDAVVISGGKRAFVMKPAYDTGAAIISLQRAARLAKATNDLSAVLASGTPRELGEASQGRTNYRIAAPSRDELWTVVETGSAKRASRVAAAEAIGATAMAGELARLEAAAIASPDRYFRHAIALILRRAEEASDAESAGTGEGGRTNGRR